jgi:hypothetical protein
MLSNCTGGEEGTDEPALTRNLGLPCLFDGSGQCEPMKRMV